MASCGGAGYGILASAQRLEARAGDAQGNDWAEREARCAAQRPGPIPLGQTWSQPTRNIADQSRRGWTSVSRVIKLSLRHAA